MIDNSKSEEDYYNLLRRKKLSSNTSYDFSVNSEPTETTPSQKPKSIRVVPSITQAVFKPIKKRLAKGPGLKDFLSSDTSSPTTRTASGLRSIARYTKNVATAVGEKALIKMEPHLNKAGEAIGTKLEDIVYKASGARDLKLSPEQKLYKQLREMGYSDSQAKLALQQYTRKPSYQQMIRQNVQGYIQQNPSIGNILESSYQMAKPGLVPLPRPQPRYQPRPQPIQVQPNVTVNYSQPQITPEQYQEQFMTLLGQGYDEQSIIAMLGEPSQPQDRPGHLQSQGYTRESDIHRRQRLGELKGYMSLPCVAKPFRWQGRGIDIFRDSMKDKPQNIFKDARRPSNTRPHVVTRRGII